MKKKLDVARALKENAPRDVMRATVNAVNDLLTPRKKGHINVLSLFDGISMGQFTIAHHLEFKNYTYYASEIHEPAIAVTMANFPKTIQLGDVTKIDTSKLPKIDLLIGGSPCQGFSLSGKGLAFDDPRSKLFFEYVRIYRELRKRNPDIKFMLENVRMAPQHLAVISKYLEVQPLYIDSSYFSVQARLRYYWTNISLPPLPTKQNKKLLHDIIDGPHYTGDVLAVNYHKSGWEQNRKVPTVFKKARTIVAAQNCINIPLSATTSRAATAIELERIAGLTDNYTLAAGGIRARRHCVGNGWETHTIAWILNNFIKQYK